MSDERYGVSDERCGVWGARCGVWAVGCGVRDSWPAPRLAPEPSEVWW